MTSEPNCWELTLANGDRYAWGHDDGVRSRGGDSEALLAQEPGAVIVGVEPQRVIVSFELGEN